MDDAIRVQEGNGERYIVADIDLHVVGQRFVRLLQKVSEGVVHQLHQQNGQARLLVQRHAQILHYIWVADLAEEATLLLEHCPVPGPFRIHQDGVEEFGRAGQLVERGPTHLAIYSRAERSVSHQTDGAETDRGSSGLRHRLWQAC